MDPLQDLLAAITNLLLPAVVVGLLLLIAWTCLLLGAFAREALERRAERPLPTVSTLEQLDRLELQLGARVDRVAFASRIAPMLGLAGTLIPLGPGLRRLGDGDLQGFGDDLVVAFSTTVAGLLVCGVCHWVASVRGRWYEADLRRLERPLAGVDRAAS